jgi:hypothetical protein
VCSKSLKIAKDFFGANLSKYQMSFWQIPQDIKQVSSKSLKIRNQLLINLSPDTKPVSDESITERTGCSHFLFPIIKVVKGTE